MFKIAKIGIEFEFDIPYRIGVMEQPARKFVDEFNSRYDGKFTIEFDKEYYASQMEFKLRSTSDISEWILVFKRFLNECYSQLPRISCIGNPYVWTHIHLFLEKDWVPYDKLARNKKLPIFNYVYNYFYNWISTNEFLRSEVMINESERLMRNHNILRYFDQKYLDNGMKKNLEQVDWSYPMFHNGINRPKYAPVIWSLANPETWKPHSLEIRSIPNSWLLTSPRDEVYSFVTTIESILNEKYNDRFDFVKSIVSTHAKFVKLVKNLRMAS